MSENLVVCRNCGVAYDLRDIWDIDGEKYCQLCAQKKSSEVYINKEAAEVIKKDDLSDVVDAADIDLRIDPLPQDQAVEHCEDHWSYKVSKAAAAVVYIISQCTDEKQRLDKGDKRGTNLGRSDETEHDTEAEFL